jgi:serine/threonine protein kinase
MDASRWDRIEEVFEAALAVSGAERAELLARACAGDATLRAEIEAMLAVAGPERALGIERLAPDDHATRDPVIGTVLGHWRVLALLGRGGMGAVYRAERADGQYAQQAALKLIAPGAWTDEAIDRFRAERQVLAGLSHPHIARLIDGGLATDDRPFLVMELVEGAPITDWCAARESSIEDRLRLFRVVCDAVQHAHGALVVHRDLKPANTFVTTAGDVKLLDFGIAKLLEPERFGVEAPATRTEAARLTPEYAAPERLFGGAVTTATDVYSLGVLLYELLTGARPLQLAGKTPIETERAMMSASIAAPSERLGLRRGDDLDAIVLTALRAHAERRYVSAGQLGEDIGRYLDGHPVHARPDTLAYRVRRFVGRNRASVAAAVTVVVALGGFGSVAVWQARRAAAERDVAQLERDKAEKVVGVLVDLFETSNPNVRGDGDRMSVRQFLAQAEPLVLDRLQSQPAVRARLRQVFGLIYVARDQYAEARTALQQALDEQRRLVGPDDPDAIESLYQLGMLAQHTGDDAGARALLEESLERSLRVFGEDHEKSARNLTALASPDRLEEAGPLLTRALAIRRRVLPANHPDLAENLGQLAHYHRLRGERERARELYTEAVAMFRTPEERLHPELITLLNDFAGLQSELGAKAEAEALLRQSLELARSVFGADSFVFANALNNLAVQLVSGGHHHEGEQLFRTSHEHHVALLGADHQRTVNVARNVGWIIALQQRYAEALTWMDRCLASLSHPTDTNDGRFHIQGRRAVILLRLGRGLEAIAALEQTLASLHAARLPGADYVITDVQLGLALALLETGRAADAEPIARAAVAATAAAGADDPTRAQAECMLGWALVVTGHPEQGSELLRRSLPTYRKWGLADPRTLASIDRVLADVKSD